MDNDSQSNASIKYSIQKGRSSRPKGREKKLNSPPQGEPWIWLPTELLCSDAWREMSVNCRKLIDHLLIEHSNHNGFENGNLKSTYNQLQEYGLTRNKIRPAIEEAEQLGLIKHKRGELFVAENQPNTYRLTFYPDKQHSYATNEWKAKTKEKINTWRLKRDQLRKNRENYKRNFKDRSKK